jgi:hypothetical protein
MDASKSKSKGWDRLRNGLAGALCAAALAALAACGGGGGGGSSSGSGGNSGGGSTSANSMAVQIEQGTGAGGNILQASVTICAPGTSNCQTIDHVLVDTGSTGVRLAASALNASLLSALPQEVVSGNALDACQQFLDGYTWGTMRTADVTLGPKSAGSVPVQIFGDSAAGSAPSTCSDSGTLTSENTPATFGTNGVIGLSGFLQDCGSACAFSAISATYYTCTASGTCQSVSVPTAQQATNVASLFAQDNNGVVIALPSISNNGQATASGTLYFGVGTQTNNAMSGATVLQTNSSSLSVTATYKGSQYADSFIDSGSNFLFLTDSSIPQCTGVYAGFYCPTSTLALTAGFATVSGGTLNENISIANAQSLFSANTSFLAFNDIAATGGSSGVSSGAIDFGIPFFYDRQIGVVVENATALGQTGPFNAIAGGP